ncbi:bifunctional riboflavin kinase/FAD synthetase [Bogoriella caseilytica]|uniref:Riboflavin biosynthesis protein n=1 Tax=Bogoriella caseilytica TaxID=56055 RepID=A0A3N2BFK3_9MICO|nr:bifunctional riboflavin kinase/FAD synthetase [Bogoriella caseilytica]ROR74029.1 riboflavin kinase/FMN adenylyltransferase [Bogoriella caseilytica]
MQVWHSVDEVPADFGATVVVLGVFDGVHRGHQQVLSAAVAHAEAHGLRSVAITFDPHPATVHRPELDFTLIASLTDRLERLEATGLNGVLVIPYSLEFARATPEEFVGRYMVELLHARQVVVGEDVRFGRDNAGDQRTMVALGREFGFDVEVIADLTCPETGRRWSSTWVRECLADGDVAEAAHVLGRPHRVRGEVVHGAKRGRDLGYPTANLRADDLGVVPADGVYAGWLIRPEHPPAAGVRKRLPAAVSVGTNPTFTTGGEPERTVEAYVLGRTDLDLYGEEVVVELVERLRGQVAFDGIPALLEQMARDVERVAQILESN